MSRKHLPKYVRQIFRGERKLTKHSYWVKAKEHKHKACAEMIVLKRLVYLRPGGNSRPVIECIVIYEAYNWRDMKRPKSMELRSDEREITPDSTIDDIYREVSIAEAARRML